MDTNELIQKFHDVEKYVKENRKLFEPHKKIFSTIVGKYYNALNDAIYLAESYKKVKENPLVAYILDQENKMEEMKNKIDDLQNKVNDLENEVAFLEGRISSAERIR